MDVKGRCHVGCKAPYAERDRQPDYDHVYSQPLQDVMKFVWASVVKRGEGQYDVTHDYLNRSTIEQAAY